MGEAGPPDDDVIGAGDSSFEDFVAGSSARLFTMARLLTGGNRAEAEDLLQGAYERAYRRWGRISRRADPERYVRQILVNASVNRWRWRRRHPEAPLLTSGPGPVTTDTAAMAASAEPAPAGLLEGIHRRAGCPPAPAGTTGLPEADAPGLTMFWQGYVSGLRGCIPLDVRSPAASRPIRVTVAVPAAAASHGC